MTGKAVMSLTTGWNTGRSPWPSWLPSVLPNGPADTDVQGQGGGLAGAGGRGDRSSLRRLPAAARPAPPLPPLAVSTWCAQSASTPSNSTRAARCPTPNWP